MDRDDIVQMLADEANDLARDLQDERDEYWPQRDEPDDYDYEEDRTVEQQERATAYDEYARGHGWPEPICTF